MGPSRVTLYHPHIIPRPTGIGNYCIELARAIRRCRPSLELVELMSDVKSKEIRIGRFRFGGILSTYIRKATLPKPTGFVHAMAPGWSTERFASSWAPDVGTVHDCTPFKIPYLYHQNVWDTISIYASLKTIRRSRHIIVPVESVKRDAMAMLGIDPRAISVIPYGVNLERYRILHGVPKEGPRFALFVGDDNPRKGLPRIIEACALAGIKLYWIGPAAWEKELHVVEATIARTGCDLIRLGYVPEERKVELYNQAAMTLLPSVDEGMGLPPLESLACGTPVVVSTAPCFAHITRSMGLKAEAMNPESIAGCIREILAQDWDPEGLRASVGGYTWERAALATLDVYDRVSGGNQ